LEEQLRWAVPASYDEAGVVATRFTISLATLRYRLVVVSCKTEIGNLQSTAVVDQKIGSLHVAM
jgi:hypothetical protein